MEKQPREEYDEQGQRSLPGEGAREEGAAAPAMPDIQLGKLDLVPPEGTSWDEWVIADGIAQAEREDRPIDNRTACYIAAFLGRASTPALRSLAMTGVVDKAGLEEEMVGRIFGQTTQVQTWIGWLANYCFNREDHGPVENWRTDIAHRDRAEAERLRRERLLAELEDLFSRPAHDELAGVEELGWFGLLHHGEQPGGWILHHQAQDDSRDVFETDSDNELVEHWRDIAETYSDMYRRTRPGAPARAEEDHASNGDEVPRFGGRDLPQP